MTGSTWIPGLDRRAVRHPADAGARRLSGDIAPVVVVGGGIAGLAAATGLAERGVPVMLIEPQPQLGGRVRAWPVDHSTSSRRSESSAEPVEAPAGEVGGDAPVTMSRGFHAFFRQYYNLRALLRRGDPGLDCLVPVPDYPLVLAGGHADSFAGIPRTPPLNLLSFVARSPAFTAVDLSRVDVAAALELLDVRFPDTFSAYDGESAAAFLDRLHFPEAARHLALEVFARSFFAPPDEFSAGELVGMFHTYFLGSAEGLLFDVPDDDYDAVLWAPLGRYLSGLGVEIHTGRSVTAIESGSEVLVTLDDGRTISASAVVLAADPATTRRLLLAAETGDDDWRARVAARRTAPPFAVWRLWLDRLVAPERTAFLGTSGFGPLDNVTVLERFERGARVWSEQHGGSVVELHAYALTGESSEAELKERMRAELNRIYPELIGAEAVAEEWLVAEDCPLADTGPWTDRLTVATPDERVVLAGDGIRCDYPVALMERAATTGWLAANQLLARLGLAGHDLWTVPMESRHRIAAPLRRMAESGRLSPRALRR